MNNDANVLPVCTVIYAVCTVTGATLLVMVSMNYRINCPQLLIENRADVNEATTEAGEFRWLWCLRAGRSNVHGRQNHHVAYA